MTYRNMEAPECNSPADTWLQRLRARHPIAFRLAKGALIMAGISLVCFAFLFASWGIGTVVDRCIGGDPWSPEQAGSVGLVALILTFGGVMSAWEFGK